MRGVLRGPLDEPRLLARADAVGHPEAEEDLGGRGVGGAHAQAFAGVGEIAGEPAGFVEPEGLVDAVLLVDGVDDREASREGRGVDGLAGHALDVVAVPAGDVEGGRAPGRQGEGRGLLEREAGILVDEARVPAGRFRAGEGAALADEDRADLDQGEHGLRLDGGGGEEGSAGGPEDLPPLDVDEGPEEGLDREGSPDGPDQRAVLELGAGAITGAERHGAERVVGLVELHLDERQEALLGVEADLGDAPEIGARGERGAAEQVGLVQDDRELRAEDEGLVDGWVDLAAAEDVGHRRVDRTAVGVHVGEDPRERARVGDERLLEARGLAPAHGGAEGEAEGEVHGLEGVEGDDLGAARAGLARHGRGAEGAPDAEGADLGGGAGARGGGGEADEGVVEVAELEALEPVDARRQGEDALDAPEQALLALGDKGLGLLTAEDLRDDAAEEAGGALPLLLAEVALIDDRVARRGERRLEADRRAAGGDERGVLRGEGDRHVAQDDLGRRGRRVGGQDGLAGPGVVVDVDGEGAGSEGVG